MQSVLWLLIIWGIQEPGHQQPNIFSAESSSQGCYSNTDNPLGLVLLNDTINFLSSLVHIIIWVSVISLSKTCWKNVLDDKNNTFLNYIFPYRPPASLLVGPLAKIKGYISYHSLLFANIVDLMFSILQLLLTSIFLFWSPFYFKLYYV